MMEVEAEVPVYESVQSSAERIRLCCHSCRVWERHLVRKRPFFDTLSLNPHDIHEEKEEEKRLASVQVSRLHGRKHDDFDRYHIISASLSEAESSLRRLEERAILEDIESGKTDQQREQEEKEMSDSELEEKLLTDITDLQEKLRTIASTLDRYALLQRRLEESPLVQRITHGTDPSTSNPILEAAIRHRDEKVTMCLTLSESVRTTREENEKLLRRKQDLIRENLELMSAETDRQMQDASSQASSTRMEGRMEKLRQRVDLIRCVFQALIIESGIDWSSDETLTQVMEFDGIDENE
eukprot:TRINITY_DN1914_c1_g1_i2.p1 TRINITY_DN1914_c1_g1~~TRINITY_DN1914_c1_g1_i2.p1  ORF type:complete len:297 (+),score=91.80 TRINITY_DN1914_c1_g1_i2:109-999(+)